tara:strand:- start:2134 stop:2289 length:156 start_codon:yes stop_codon:yes gene_type:complete
MDWSWNWMQWMMCSSWTGMNSRKKNSNWMRMNWMKNCLTKSYWKTQIAGSS